MRRRARSASPDAVLAPVLLRHFLRPGQPEEWALTGRDAFVTGFQDHVPEADLWAQLLPLVEAAGGTGEALPRAGAAHAHASGTARWLFGAWAGVSAAHVLQAPVPLTCACPLCRAVCGRRVVGGDKRGLLVYVTLATAQQAAAVIECLQGVEVRVLCCCGMRLSAALVCVAPRLRAAPWLGARAACDRLGATPRRLLQVGGRQLHVRPFKEEVEKKCRMFPAEAAAAERALAAAAAAHRRDLQDVVDRGPRRGALLQHAAHQAAQLLRVPGRQGRHRARQHLRGNSGAMLHW